MSLVVDTEREILTDEEAMKRRYERAANVLPPWGGRKRSVTELPYQQAIQTPQQHTV